MSVVKRTSILVLLVALCAFGCKRSEPTTTTSVSSTQTTVTTANTATTATASTSAALTPAPVPASATAGAIASTDGEKPGTHIDITELKRASGGTVNLKFTIANGGNQDLHLYSEYLGDPNVSKDHFRDVSGVHLIDPLNKKKYFVVTDSDKSCVCSKEIPDVKPGEKLNVWAKFPAPAPEVMKVTIEIPHFAPMDDVPISQ